MRSDLAMGPTAAILIVDDHPANLITLEAVLAPLQRRVVSARSGEEALRYLLHEEFAVVLLDVRMPGIDGFETARLMRQRERTRRVPIIFISGVTGDPSQVMRAYAQGAVDYLVKPFDADIMRSKVSVFVDLYLLREQVRNLSSTEAARLEAARLAEIHELYIVNRLATVGELAASMAHELGTPLAVVQARAQMIAAGEVDPSEQRKEAEVIVQQTRRMTKMVSDVLELARPKAPVKVAVDLSALARQTVSLLETLAHKRRAKLVLDGAPAGMAVRGDASQLLQVLTNLTMNAIQSMPEGGVVRLAVAQRRARPPKHGPAADYLCVDVRDGGDGIPDAVRPHLFETFFTTKKTGEGTGLGLSVSYRLAHDHDGWIGVESTLGEGSCFTLYLPPLQVG